MPKLLTALLFAFICQHSAAQVVYITPSGNKYHTATCRYVKNVSNKLTLAEVNKQGLTACSQCIKKTDIKLQGITLGIKPGEAKGTNKQSHQCRAMTKAKQRCKRTTKNVNGFCFQHEE